MKKIRCYLLTLLTLITVMFCFSVPVLANNSAKGKNTTAEYSMILTNLDTGEMVELSQDDLNIQISTEKDANGNIKKSITADVAVPSTSSNDANSNLISPYAVVTDGGVTTRLTFNLNYTQSGSLYKITSANGKFELLDSAFTISGRMVRLANYQYNETQYIRTYYPGNTFSYPGYSNWVNINYGPAVVAGYAKCNITRSSSTWELRLNQYIATNVPDMSFF